MFGFFRLVFSWDRMRSELKEWDAAGTRVYPFQVSVLCFLCLSNTKCEVKMWEVVCLCCFQVSDVPDDVYEPRTSWWTWRVDWRPAATALCQHFVTSQQVTPPSEGGQSADHVCWLSEMISVFLIYISCSRPSPKYTQPEKTNSRSLLQRVKASTFLCFMFRLVQLLHNKMHFEVWQWSTYCIIKQQGASRDEAAPFNKIFKAVFI